MKAPKVRTRFDRLRRVVVEATPPEKSLTQQQFKDECDMNRIVKNALRGVAPRFQTQGVPQYGEFADIPVDLTEVYNVVARAEESFNTLPAGLRAELGNDPSRFNELTREQAERYKLLKAHQEPPMSDDPPPASPPPKAAPKAGQAAPKAPKEPSTD